jgi:hypothetical protein
MFDYLAGRLLVDIEHEKVFWSSMESGQVWAPTVYHAYKSVSFAEMGLKTQAEIVLDHLNIIVESLENDFSQTQYYRANQTYLLKYRRLEEVIQNSAGYITFIGKTDHKSMLLLNYCIVSMAFSLKGNIREARRYYMQAEELSKILWLKYYISITLLAKAFIELSELRNTGSAGSKEALARFSGTTAMLVSTSKKVNCLITEALRFRAISFMLSGKSKKALYYFNKSIDFARWYGANVELSRTFFELGKFLSAPGTKPKQLNGLTGEGYLEKARRMFEEMDLQWDLEEYERYMEG